MIASLRRILHQRQILTLSIAAAVLAMAFMLGRRAAPIWLGLLITGAGGVLLLARPVLGLPALLLAALVVPLEFGTGTAVSLNTAALLVPAMLMLWLLSMVRQRQARIAHSSANRPLLLFLGASILSLLIGVATWDPMVPRSDNFTLVQISQWALFAFSAGAFTLTANLATGEKWLHRMTWVFLLVGGGVAIGRQVPGVASVLNRITTIAFTRAPLWALLVSLAGGQLLFNYGLRPRTRLFLGAVLAAAFVYAFVDQQEATSNWVGIGTALAMLAWLRYPRLRWIILILVVAFAASGALFPAIYDFAGGDDAWVSTGASRLVLIERVIDVTMRNPITGLGPAGYRPYANATPLKYVGAYWVEPRISSHNNYVDLFAHGGVMGLALFAWFAVEIARLELRLRQRYTTGFASAYVNGMLAAGAASLVLMAFADWILPFVYNIGFPGFQASVLVWLFLGGLVALDNMPAAEPA